MSVRTPATLATILVATLALLACQTQAKGETAGEPAAKTVAPADNAEAPAKAAEGDKKPKKTYEIKVGKAAMKSGAEAKADVAVLAAKGYKWNKEYPAKLTLKPGTKAKLAKTEFKQLAGDFKLDGDNASVAVALTGDKPGEETVKGELKFSVCNEKTCLIEKAEVQIAVNVTP